VAVSYQIGQKYTPDQVEHLFRRKKVALPFSIEHPKLRIFLVAQDWNGQYLFEIEGTLFRLIDRSEFVVR
jgi:hypothetical protein